MPVTEEDGGRLNAFAKEPKIEVVDQEASKGNLSWLIIVAMGVVLAGIITFSISVG